MAHSLARIAEGMPCRDTNVPRGRRRGRAHTVMHAPRAKMPNCANGDWRAPASWSSMTPTPTSPASRDNAARTGERCPFVAGTERST